MDAEQERNWAIACHLSGVLWVPLLLVGVGWIPFTNLIAPALIWSFKKEKSKLIDDHGKESLNFQLSMTIYNLVVLIFVVAILILIATAMTPSEGDSILTALSETITGDGLIWGLFLGLAIFVAIAIFQIVVVVFAVLKAKEGDIYRYPFNLRLLKD